MNTFFASRINQILGTVALLGVVVALGAYAHLAWQEARYVAADMATINVTGSGEATAIPDIGTFTFSVVAEAETAEAAQADAAERNNAILEYLETTGGVAEADVKTSGYDLSPQYRYSEPDAACVRRGECPPEERTLVGYEVRQSVEVRVRDTDTAGELVSGVGERGATNISQLRFTIDDDSVYVAEARAEAIAEAQDRAEELAEDLGVTLVRIVSFNEDGSGPSPYMRQEAMMAEDSAGPSPDMPVGEDTITRTVQITYEIR